MKNNAIKLANALFVLYVFIPAVIYGSPYIVSIINTETLDFHFYSTIVASQAILLEILIIHIFLGLMIYLSFRNVAEVKRKRSNFAISIGAIFAVVSILELNSYVTIFSFVIFVIILSNYSSSILFSLALVVLGSLDLLLNESRNFFIWILMLVYLHHANKRIGYLIGLSFGALLLMVFILQPLKHKTSPADAINEISDIQHQTFIHLAPIFLTAISSAENNMSAVAHFSEMLPGVRLITGEISVIDSLSQEYLPAQIYKEGTRLGSNSALLLDTSATFPLLICLLVVGISSKVAKHSVIARNSIIGYLVIYGPYFIRRSIYSYVYDLIFLLIIVAVVLIINKLTRVAVLKYRVYN